MGSGRHSEQDAVFNQENRKSGKTFRTLKYEDCEFPNKNLTVERKLGGEFFLFFLFGVGGKIALFLKFALIIGLQEGLSRM